MWLKVDDGFVEHAKTIAAGDRLGGGAALGRVVAVWLEAALYCSRALTNGYISARVVARLLVDDAPLEVAGALVDAGLWTTAPDGFRFHDWDDYQPDAAKTKARRAKDRRRKRRQAEDTDAPLLQDQDAAGRPISASGDHPSLNNLARFPHRSPRGIHAESARKVCGNFVPVPVPVLDPDQKRTSSARRFPDRARPARMPWCSVFEVRTHLLAAVHHLLDAGPPYVNAAGVPVLAELTAEVKRIAAHDLGAEWEGRELHAIVEAALARRRQADAARRAREAFARRERAAMALVRRRG